MSEVEVDTYPIKEGLDGLTVEVHYGLAGLASAVRDASISHAEVLGGDEVNVVDGLFAISESISDLAEAIKCLHSGLKMAPKPENGPEAESPSRTN